MKKLDVDNNYDKHITKPMFLDGLGIPRKCVCCGVVGVKKWLKINYNFVIIIGLTQQQQPSEEITRLSAKLVLTNSLFFLSKNASIRQYGLAVTLHFLIMF